MADHGEKKLEDVLDVNLYSRQIYALGQTAMFRLRSASVLVSGIGSVGVEVAKNLVLGGVRHVTLQDTKLTTYNDLSAEFYLTEADVGKNRAEAAFTKIEELNDSVSVKVTTDPLTEEQVKQYNLIIVTDTTFDDQVQINAWARAAGAVFISADTTGLYGYVFNDLGESFQVDDADGEHPKEIWLENIDIHTGAVHTHDGALHGLSTGDYVQFDEVKGCTQLNGHAPIRIEVTGKNSFNIGDVAKNFGAYTEGGRVIEVKRPFEVKSEPINVRLQKDPVMIWDFQKFESPAQLQQLFIALSKFIAKHGRKPAPYDATDADELRSFLPNPEAVSEHQSTLFSYISAGSVQPLASVVGGIAAQEVMKSITHHTTPLNGFLFIDSIESLPIAIQEANLKAVDPANFQPRKSRYDGQAAIFGWDFQQKIKDFSLFVVGAGAIGCELLKNFALMGVATGKGVIKITDMDQIEVSNLNRQFLFRRNDVGGKKSEVAAAAVKQFNKDLNILALADRVAEDTESVFTDDFFGDLDCVTNALDNIDARRYMDRRCVYYLLPLLESGTMGAKGNTQVVYPYLTESYSSTNDPPEKDIPICTLKNFPYEIQHTIQWARDVFEGLFTNPAETTNQFVSDERQFLQRIEAMNGNQQIEMLETVKRSLLDDRPKSPEDCIKWARLLFQSYYHDQISQLLYSFPADQTTAEGVKFWSGTKRCPHVVQFDPSKKSHFDFVYAASILRAQQYHLEPITEKNKILKVVQGVKIPNFTPKRDLKIATTESEAAEQANEVGDDTETRINNLKLALARLTIRDRLDPIDFEKDDDTNHHMEFITAASNLRAENYEIPPADVMKTKQIAGRIIPALATTTAVVAGLVGLELYKVIDLKGQQKKATLERFKSAFINLALPLFAFGEPIGAPKREYNGKTFTLWDRIEVNGPMTLQALIDRIAKETGCEITMMSSGVSLLYAFFHTARARQRLALDVIKAVEEVVRSPIPSYRKAIVLEVTASNENDDDVEVPYIKYNIA